MLDEVSIGHALISDALYLGFENAIQMYKRQLGQLNRCPYVFLKFIQKRNG